MGVSAAKLASRFMDEARKRPAHLTPKIYRSAATVFAGLASDPQNAKHRDRLQAIALDFAGAASQWRHPPTVEDFSDLLAETALAYQQAGGEGSDPMDLVAIRREIHEARTANGATPTSIAPESFNEDATLGRSAVIKFAPTQEEIANTGIAQSQTVAFWQGKKREAQAMTVDTALVSPNAPVSPNADGINDPVSVRAYGICEFGADGNHTSVKFDIGRGTRFTVVGNYVSLLVGCDEPARQQNDPTAFAPTAPVTVGASIGPFAAPSQAPVIFTQYLDELAGTSSIAPARSGFISIPLKAVQLLPLQTNMAIGEKADIEFYAYGGGAAPISTIFYQQSDTSSMDPVPLYGDTWFIRIRNHAAGPRNFRIPFQLSM